MQPIKALLFCALLACSSGVALPAEESDVAQTILSVTLSDGRVLQQVEFKSFGAKAVMLRHAEGVAQIAYEQFPDPLREALLRKKPTSTAPAATQPKASAPATRTRAPAARAAGRRTGATLVTGVVYNQVGARKLPMAEAPVYIFDAPAFASFDASRRVGFTPGHEQIRRRLAGDPTLPNPSPAEIDAFFKEEFESWDKAPAPVAAARADENGEFAIAVPDTITPLVFVRMKGRQNNRETYHVWAIPAGEEPVLVNQQTEYPVLQAEPPSYR